jgi:hyperosmotically inducible periplasmic protein
MAQLEGDKTMKRTVLTTVLMASLALPLLANNQPTTPDQQDIRIKTLVTEQLQKKSVSQSLSADVSEGIVTISGNVPLYIDKMNAEQRVRRVKNVDGVRNHVRVDGPAIADSALRDTLTDKLRYDRIGYGILFNSLLVGVNNGVVTVSGNVHDYADRDSAIAIVATTEGVKDVVEEIDVAPASIFDDNLRVKLARVIYGHSSLQRYALDPQAPIRIVVENGHVELTGVVQNDLDRQIAYAQANSVAGVFSVTNHLATANAVHE